MARLRRQEIEDIAAQLLERHAADSLPIPLGDIAAAERIEVIRVVADWNESGFLLREEGRHPIIGINSRNSLKRQRFTIAHELGHWQLHEGQALIVDQSVMINKRNDVSSKAEDWQEIQANQFAAALLMPQHLVSAAVDRLAESGLRSREELISDLAKKFQVSNDAMSWRLVNLGILSS